MELGREARRSDPLGRYYTESVIGRQLVKEMNLPKPNTVIDLGAGSGILSREASKIWTASSFYTVDIDDAAGSSSFPSIHGANFKHHIGDALEFGLAEKLGLKRRAVDAAICNPPYLLPKWKKHFGDILDDAGLGAFVPKSGDITADMLFIAQNLRLLSGGGKLGLILPDGIVSGEKYQRLRRELMLRHCVEKIVELPRRAFKKTDAKAHIVILSKDKPCENFVPVSRLNADGSLAKVIMAPSEDFCKRLDYSFLEGKKKVNGRKKIGDYTEASYRGSASSADIAKSEIPIFHTTDFDSNGCVVPKRFHLLEALARNYSGPTAMEGDILVARVGRNLSSKIAIVKHPGAVAVSDCIIVLRVKKNIVNEVFDFLKSYEGKESIEAMTKGVAAKYLTIGSISEIRF